MELNNPYNQYIIKEPEIKTALDHEKEFKEPLKIDRIDHGCPLCGGEVKGNDKINYYCDNCNMLFTTLDLISFEKLSSKKTI